VPVRRGGVGTRKKDGEGRGTKKTKRRGGIPPCVGWGGEGCVGDPGKQEKGAR